MSGPAAARRPGFAARERRVTVAGGTSSVGHGLGRILSFLGPSAPWLSALKESSYQTVSYTTFTLLGLIPTSARIAGTSAPTLAAGAELLWLNAKLMLARLYSGLSSREVCLRKSLGEGSCELVRASTGDDLAESADCERVGVCRGGLERKRSRLFFSDVGESAEREVRSRRLGVRREGVGSSWLEPWDCASLSLTSRSSRALFSARSFSNCARVAGPGTTNLGGGARAEA